jgi:phospholipase/carboxylesterase
MTNRMHNSTKCTAFNWLLAAVLAGAVTSMARAAGDEPPDFNKLQRELRQAYDSGNYQKALETAEKMHELRPDDIDTMYNMACMHCLLGHKDKAYEWLEKAIDAGYDDADHLSSDDDFKTIRGEDRFRDIVKKLREGSKKAPAKKEGEKETKKTEGKKEKKQTEERAEKKTEKRAEKKAEQKEQPEKPKKPAQPEKPAKPEKPGKAGQFQLSEREKVAKVEELTQELIKASDAKEHWKALSLALEARVLLDNALTNYNAACMYSILGKKDEAFCYLERAIDLGGLPNMAKQMEGDSDFDNIRKDPRYAELLKRAGGGEAKPGKKPGKEEGQQVDAEWQVTAPKGLDKSKKAPLIVALHDRKGNMDATIDRWKPVAAEVGAVLLTPQGTVRLGDDQYDWGSNLDSVEENVMDAIDEAMEDHQIDKKRVVVVGFGEGGSLAWSMALRNPDVFRGVVALAGKPADKWEDDVEEGALKNLRIYALVGDDDEQLIKADKQAAKKLKEMGVQVEVRTIKGLGHEFPKNAKEELSKALEFALED